jgi:hypothetical protein
MPLSKITNLTGSVMAATDCASTILNIQAHILTNRMHRTDGGVLTSFSDPSGGWPVTPKRWRWMQIFNLSDWVVSITLVAIKEWRIIMAYWTLKRFRVLRCVRTYWEVRRCVSYRYARFSDFVETGQQAGQDGFQIIRRDAFHVRTTELKACENTRTVLPCS